MKSGFHHLVLGFSLFFASVAVSFAQKTPAEPEAAVIDDMDDYATVKVSDPLEPMNRAIFKFNDGLYDYVFRPVSKGYTKVVPTPVRYGIRNFFENLRFPIRFVNSALQGCPA